MSHGKSDISKDASQENSESWKKKARAESQLKPADCTVPPYGEKPIYPPYYDQLMKIADDYSSVFDSRILFNERPIAGFAPLPVDPNFDPTAFDDGPEASTPVSRPGDEQKKAAIAERCKEWEEEAKKERAKPAEQKEKEAKERADLMEEFRQKVEAFYDDKGIAFHYTRNE